MRLAPMLVAATATLALVGAGPASAKQCRDASGHFITCPAEKTTSTTTSTKCRDAKGAFTKCPGSEAAAMVNSTTTKTTKMAKGAKTETTTAMNSAMAPATSASSAAKNTAATAAGAVTAKCKDGTMSHSQHRSGTCAGHGGVASWM